MTERELYNSLGQEVKVFCKDGQILEGIVEGFDNSIDNAPREASIDIKMENRFHCIVIYADEIEKIELTDK